MNRIGELAAVVRAPWKDDERQINSHSDAQGVWCPWSLVAVSERYPLRSCPSMCPNSRLEQVS